MGVAEVGLVLENCGVFGLPLRMSYAIHFVSRAISKFIDSRLVDSASNIVVGFLSTNLTRFRGYMILLGVDLMPSNKRC